MREEAVERIVWFQQSVLRRQPVWLCLLCSGARWYRNKFCFVFFFSSKKKKSESESENWFLTLTTVFISSPPPSKLAKKDPSVAKEIRVSGQGQPWRSILLRKKKRRKIRRPWHQRSSVNLYLLRDPFSFHSQNLFRHVVAWLGAKTVITIIIIKK